MSRSKRTGAQKRWQEKSCRDASREILAQERGFVPPQKEASVRIALVFPNRYGVGMSNLGFQTVLRLWNQCPGIRCERAFFPNVTQGDGVSTLESCKRLNTFDIVGFSLSFELDLVHIIQCLIETGIPPLREDRTEHDPIVFAGGALAGMNPSPLLPFIDGLLVGEGEGVLEEMAGAFVKVASAGKKKEARLDALACLNGVFIPGRNQKVTRHTLRSLEAHPTYTSIITSFSHFEDMFVVEVGRGCTRGCLFCAAQKIYNPYRFRSPEMIVETVARFNPGSHRIGLEGAGLSDYPELESLSETLVKMGYETSFSSIRSDRITPDLIRILERGGVRSITMAPEAGSERLRHCIGKGISDTKLRECADLLGRSAIATLKLYYLIGLPGEKEEDLLAIIDAVLDLSGRFIGNNKRKRVRISVNSFVPKAFTEFQWTAMDTEREIARKRRLIASALRSTKQVTVIPKSSRSEVLQGILSKGDERVGLALLDEQLQNWSLKQAFTHRGVDPQRLVHRTGSVEDSLPWDFIESGIDKHRLWTRYRSHMEL